MRKVIFENGYFYHIYNRGVDKRRLFLNKHDYLRFLKSMSMFNVASAIGGLRNIERLSEAKRRGSTSAVAEVEPLRTEKPLVEIVAYSLIGNHFHFILRQMMDRGISMFMQRLGTSYTMYFNNKYNRSGVLFQGKYKAIYIKDDNYLASLSAYVNCNSEIHNVCKAEKHNWSSYRHYLSGEVVDKNVEVKKEHVINMFRTLKDYENFVKDIIIRTKENRGDLRNALR